MAYGYQNGKLSLMQGDQSLALLDLAQELPVYVYDLDAVQAQVQELKKALPKAQIFYAMKANSNLELLKFLRGFSGLGLDVVSLGEMKRGIQAGFSAKEMIFSGVGKSVEEIEFGLRESLGQFNIESVSELKRIAKIASKLKIKAPIAIRFNPDVEAETHPYIKTGFRENKFGLGPETWPELKKVLNEFKSSTELVGLTMHIGSQLMTPAATLEAIEKTKLFADHLQREGFLIRTFDIGGGWGVDYSVADGEKVRLQEFAETLRPKLDQLPYKILCEPGRILVARSGVLLAKVEYIKRTPYKNFAILNTGMNHLMRPALYQAKHRILPLVEKWGQKETFDVVGPICESSDTLAHSCDFQGLEEGDHVAIMDTGAYGFVMASRYNLHEEPQEILIQNGKQVESL